ncbi:MAG TPA: NADH-quinone oxidoreductase subunit J [Pyrinomonadaceae bacterium]|nr:NADH-quinone oxidoreductase subunit J [Pyrinomonadaceae bacterium]
MVVQRNPLYSAISLIGVFVSLSCLYVMLAAPFIAAVQVIVYAGAIMVLVIFVIMLLNVEEEEPRSQKLRFLVPVAVLLAAVLIAETAFILSSVQMSPYNASAHNSSVGLTSSIGIGMFTKYLLPFEITSVLLLMAIVGAMSLARRSGLVGPETRIIPGSQVLPVGLLDRERPGDLTPVDTDSTAEAGRLMGFEDPSHRKDE